MKRMLWLIFGALALVAAALVLRFPQEELAGHQEPVSRDLPDVRVEHEFVRVPDPQLPAIASDTGRRSAVSTPTVRDREVTLRTAERSLPAVTRASSQPPPVQRAGQERTLLEKARRAFVGDGRHRPEPFPRVRDN